MKNETSAVYDVLGIDVEESAWQDFAMCRGWPISLFHEAYESSKRTAKEVDQMCLSCPVRAMCLAAGVENNEWGVWGGVYLIAGRADEAKNDHKTPDIWEKIREDIQ